MGVLAPPQKRRKQGHPHGKKLWPRTLRFIVSANTIRLTWMKTKVSVFHAPNQKRSRRQGENAEDDQIGYEKAQGRRRMPRRRWSGAISASPRPNTSRSTRSLNRLGGGVRSASIVMPAGAPPIPCHPGDTRVLDERGAGPGPSGGHQSRLRAPGRVWAGARCCSPSP
jgi:hypothetical protein